MHTTLKIFELLPMESKAALQIPGDSRKVAVRMNAEDKSWDGQEKASFLECLNTLVSMDNEKVKASLEQLEWIAIDGNQETMAPVIDLTTDDAERSSILLSLLGSLLGEDGQIDPDKILATEPVSDGLNPETQSIVSEGDLDTKPGIKNWVLKQTPTTNPGIQKAGTDTFPNSAENGSSVKTADVQAYKTDVDQTNIVNRFQSNSDNRTLPDQGPADLDKKNAAVTDQPRPSIDVDDSKSLKSLQAAAKQSPQAKDSDDPNDMQIEAKTNPNGNKTTQAGKGTTSQTIALEALNADRNQETRQSSRGFDRDDTGAFQRQVNAKSANGDASALFFQSSSADGGGQEQQGSLPRETSIPVEMRLASGAAESADATAVKENHDSQGTLKTMQHDVIRQIVQRMTLRSNGVQSQMSVQLKPEFLGNLKLDIVAENHHVLVKMTAESPAVKEMIEQGLPMLKMELQQHGLNIDKFDVFVGQENETWKQSQQQSASRQGRRGDFRKAAGIGNESDDDDQTLESSANSTELRGYPHRTEIDFFA